MTCYITVAALTIGAAYLLIRKARSVAHPDYVSDGWMRMKSYSKEGDKLC